MREILTILIILPVITSAIFAEGYQLTPFNFGLAIDSHHGIDVTKIPPDLVVGQFNGDRYPDIAKYVDNRVEVFFRKGNYFNSEPSLVKNFDGPIDSMWMEGEQWVWWWDIMVKLTNGRVEKFNNTPNGLRVEDENPKQKFTPPKRVQNLDFQLVWQSESRPFGMTSIAVGDLDNDNINELVTWYKDFETADTAWFLFYKSVGDDEYELYMQERFRTDVSPPGLNSMLITDMDRNGQKELLWAYDKIYLWEFSSPDEWAVCETSYIFFLPVYQVNCCDIDNDSIPEIAAISASVWLAPPCTYDIQEYLGRFPFYFYFETIMSHSQDWPDYSFSVGDFDNDGYTDVVSGNYGYVFAYEPVDLQYFRFDSPTPDFYTQRWLSTGIASSCATPAISDLDGDGLNELCAGGLCPTNGSAFIYKSSGFENGEVVWRDTSTMSAGPYESAAGEIEGSQKVVSIRWGGGVINNTVISVLGYEDLNYTWFWESEPIDSMVLTDIEVFDIDEDGKTNIIIANRTFPSSIRDFEQIIDFINNPQEQNVVNDFILTGMYPNPFNSNFIIKYSVNNSAKSLNFKVFNIFGQECFNRNITEYNIGNNEFVYDASALPSGIYFVRLQYGVEKYSEKVVLLK